MIWCTSDPPFSLLARPSMERTPPRPSIWSMYRPVDITLYDLLYEDELYPVKRASGWNDSRSSLNVVDLVESFHTKKNYFLDYPDFY